MHQLRNTATAALIGLCVLSSGCTTTRFLPVPGGSAAASTNNPQVGRKITVTLNSGEVRAFRLTALEADALVGKDIRIPFSEIERLQERKISIGRTAGLIGGVVLVAVGTLAAILINAAEEDE